MSPQSPAWAHDLSAVLTLLANTRPQPVLPFLSMTAGATVTSAEFAEFVRDADRNHPAIIQLRNALADWDACEVVDFKDSEGNPTPRWSAARRLAVHAALGFDNAMSAAVEAKYPYFGKPFTTVSDRPVPQWRAMHRRRTSVYWDGYERYLRDVKEWSDEAISTLHQATREVISQFGDPTSESDKRTKGLVVGHVQSGKTAHFTGLVARAIDEGFRLIIVLSGTIEILRAQTQRRMDMELIGVENILNRQNPDDPRSHEGCEYQDDKDWQAGRFIRHGAALQDADVVYIDRVTTFKSDFKGNPSGVAGIKFRKAVKGKPLNHPENLFQSDAVVAVVKKRPAPLGRLIADLEEIRGDLEELPVLIIDDESDQASIDTTPLAKRWKPSQERNRTTINQQITDILRLCPRAKYVAYTATAFATVFIDRDDPEDLFPSDFMLLLDAPRGYMGLEQFHDINDDPDGEPRTIANSNQLAHVRLPADDRPLGLGELREAIDSWVLSGAIKLFRRTKCTTAKSRNALRHHTMLIHKSTSKAKHFAAAREVRTLWDTSAFDSSEGLQRLRELYHRDHHTVMQARPDDGYAVPSSFEEIEPFVMEALTKMAMGSNLVLVINSDDEVQDHKEELNFATDEVWRILVGGEQLSRGFTVEGLTVSYFTRKTKQGDTLMQAGRWFGFRDGYKDLVRLYIDRELYGAFEARLLEEKDFRERIRDLQDVDENGKVTFSPRNALIMVEQHLSWLKPTSPPKMRNAVTVSEAPVGRFRDLYRIPPQDSRSANIANLLDVGIPLLAAATQETVLRLNAERRDIKVPTRIGTIEAEQFLRVFDKYHWHEAYDGIDPLKKFLSDKTAGGLITDWAVVWPQPRAYVGKIEFDELGVSAPIITRSRRDRDDFVGSASDHRDAAMPIARGEIGIPGSSPSRSRGVVLIYLVDDRPQDIHGKRIGPLRRDRIVPLMSIAVPTSTTPRKGKVTTRAVPLARARE